MNIKDFINEGKTLEETEVIKENETTKSKVKNKPVYEVILENDSDFVLERKTTTTDKMLVCILSQGLHKGYGERAVTE